MRRHCSTWGPKRLLRRPEKAQPVEWCRKKKPRSCRAKPADREIPERLAKILRASERILALDSRGHNGAAAIAEDSAGAAAGRIAGIAGATGEGTVDAGDLSVAEGTANIAGITADMDSSDVRSLSPRC